MEKSKKLLISFSGHARTYKEALPTQLELVVRPLSAIFSIDIRFLIYENVYFDEEVKVDEQYINDIFQEYTTSIKLLSENSLIKKSPGHMFSLIESSLLNENNKYDFLLRTRPDLKFLSAIDINELMGDFDIAFPRFGHFLDGRNDQFFLIKSNSINQDGFKIFDFFNSDGAAHPETLLKKYIAFLCLKERFLNSINYVILRKSSEDDQRQFYRI